MRHNAMVSSKLLGNFFSAQCKDEYICNESALMLDLYKVVQSFDCCYKPEEEGTVSGTAQLGQAEKQPPT